MSGSRLSAHAEALRRIPHRFRVLLAGCEDQALRRRPAPGEWSAIEVCGHVLDKLTMWRARVERIASEQVPTLPGYDQDALVRQHDYQHADLLLLEQQLAQAAERFARTAEALPEAALTRMGQHAELGPLSLAQCIDLPLASIEDHARQCAAALVADG